MATDIRYNKPSTLVPQSSGQQAVFFKDGAADNKWTLCYNNHIDPSNLTPFVVPFVAKYVGGSFSNKNLADFFMDVYINGLLAISHPVVSSQRGVFSASIALAPNDTISLFSRYVAGVKPDGLMVVLVI